MVTGEEIQSCLKRGMSPLEIRKLYPGIVPSRISKERAVLGIECFKRGPVTGSFKDRPVNVERRKLISELRAKGMTFVQISEQMGLCRQRIFQLHHSR